MANVIVGGGVVVGGGITINGGSGNITINYIVTETSDRIITEVGDYIIEQN